MPSVSEVRPKIWDNVLDLYDDGTFSAIWGSREESESRELGVRWNGENGYVGYPNQGANPVWFSQPSFLEKAILLSLIDKLSANPALLRKDEFVINILIALQESNHGAGPS